MQFSRTQIGELLANIMTNYSDLELLAITQYEIVNLQNRLQRRRDHVFCSGLGIHRLSPEQRSTITESGSAWYDINLAGWWIRRGTRAHTTAILLGITE